MKHRYYSNQRPIEGLLNYGGDYKQQYSELIKLIKIK